MRIKVNGKLARLKQKLHHWMKQYCSFTYRFNIVVDSYQLQATENINYPRTLSLQN